MDRLERFVVCGAVVGLALVSPRGPAQTEAVANAAKPSVPAKALPAYDVATIKPNKDGRLGVIDITEENATYVTHDTGLKPMLQEAFGIQLGLIYGLPGWAEAARYDVSAKVLEPDMEQLHTLTTEQRRAMLRKLLEERFGLKWHFETKTLPVLELTVAKGGPKFQEVRGPEAGGDGTHGTNNEMGIQNVPMADFCEELSGRLQRPVVDKTGLTGKYTFLVKFTPEGDPATNRDRGVAEPEAPGLFTALQEQLGLRLQGGKAPVQTVVIDSVSPPTEN